MPNIKVMVSLHPDLLEAVDAVASREMVTRSALITRILRDDADVYEVLEGIKEGQP